MNEKYQTIFEKANYIIKLAVPKVFQEEISKQIKEQLQRKGSFLGSRYSMIAMENSQFKRGNSLLIRDGSISQKDVEYDWTDRLRQWKEVQRSRGSVTSMTD